MIIKLIFFFFGRIFEKELFVDISGVLDVSNYGLVRILLDYLIYFFVCFSFKIV